MKLRNLVLAVLALAAAAGGGAGIAGSTSPGQSHRLVPGNPAEVEQADRRARMLCKLEGESPPA